jgi:hypothetical protein
VIEDRIKIGDLSPGDVALLKDVAEAAAEKAVNKTLLAMGLDPSDPIKAQQDFSIMRYVGDKVREDEFKEDLAWVRRARKRSDGIIGKVLLTAVGLGVVGALHALWQGIKTFVGSGAH